MLNAEIQILPLKQAAEYFGVEPPVLENSAKHLGCRIMTGGVPFINVTRFEELAVKKVVRKTADPQDRKKRKTSLGQKIGTLKGRITRTPRNIQSRKHKLEEAKADLADATTPYDKDVAQKAMAIHTEKIKQFEQQLKDDKKELNRLQHLKVNGSEVEAPGKTVDAPSTANAPSGEI